MPRFRGITPEHPLADGRPARTIGDHRSGSPFDALDQPTIGTMPSGAPSSAADLARILAEIPAIRDMLDAGILGTGGIEAIPGFDVGTYQNRGSRIDQAGIVDPRSPGAGPGLALGRFGLVSYGDAPEAERGSPNFVEPLYAEEWLDRWERAHDPSFAVAPGAQGTSDPMWRTPYGTQEGRWTEPPSNEGLGSMAPLGDNESAGTDQIASEQTSATRQEARGTPPGKVVQPGPDSSGAAYEALGVWLLQRLGRTPVVGWGKRSPFPENGGAIVNPGREDGPRYAGSGRRFRIPLADEPDRWSRGPVAPQMRRPIPIDGGWNPRGG